MFNKKASLILLAFALPIQAGSQLLKNVISTGDIILDNRYPHESIQGSGNLKSENRTHLIENKKINAIAVASSIRAVIKENEAPYFMSVTSDDNILEYIKTETQNEILKIYFSPGSYTFTKAEVIINVPYNLQQYKATGCSKIETSSEGTSENAACSLNARGCSKIVYNQPCRKIEELTIDSSGTSTIDIVSNNDIKKVDIRASGCSKVHFAPRAKDILIHYLIIKASGTSKVDLSSLKIARCKGRISGASKLVTNTIESKDIDISGVAKHTEIHE
jgi:hypothetical protein